MGKKYDLKNPVDSKTKKLDKRSGLDFVEGQPMEDGKSARSTCEDRLDGGHTLLRLGLRPRGRRHDAEALRSSADAGRSRRGHRVHRGRQHRRTPGWPSVAWQTRAARQRLGRSNSSSLSSLEDVSDSLEISTFFLSTFFGLAVGNALQRKQ